MKTYLFNQIRQFNPNFKLHFVGIKTEMHIELHFVCSNCFQQLEYIRTAHCFYVITSNVCQQTTMK